MGWRQNTRAVIRAYPELKRRERELHETAVTARYTAEPGGGSASRSTENAATRTLPPDDQRALDAVEKAVRITRSRYQGHARLRIIELVYWKRSHTLEGAAQKVHVSIQTAKFWHGEFLTLVDAFLRDF